MFRSDSMSSQRLSRQARKASILFAFLLGWGAIQSRARAEIVGTATIVLPIGSKFVLAQNSVADFGNPLHSFGSPQRGGTFTYDYFFVSGQLRAQVFVNGRLYWDASRAGTARMEIEYLDENKVVLATDIVSVSGPGGDPNLAGNNVVVTEDFAHPRLCYWRYRIGELVGGVLRITEEGTQNLPGVDVPVVARRKLSSNDGTADFGSGSHLGGEPLGTATLRFLRLGGAMGASVTGTLYWDALVAGQPRLDVRDLTSTGGVIRTRTRTSGVACPGLTLFTPTGANDARNQVPVDLPAIMNAGFFQVQLRVGNLIGGNFVNIRSTDLRFHTNLGTFELAPELPVIAVGQQLDYRFRWTVPPPRNWHDLQSLALRIREADGNGRGEGHGQPGPRTVLSLLFDEATQSFALVDEETGEPGPFVPAGSGERLETSHAILHLADTRVVGSGPTGPAVDLHLSLEFKPRASGKAYIVNVGATDDEGAFDQLSEVGPVRILPWGQGHQGNPAGAATRRDAGGATSEDPMTKALVAPGRLALYQNWPNPFAEATTITFDLPRSERVRIEIFDTRGRRVTTLADGVFKPGRRSVEWNRRDGNGHRVAQGIYLCRIVAGPERAATRMALLP